MSVSRPLEPVLGRKLGFHIESEFEVQFFPGKGAGPGCSLCAVPFLPGVVLPGVGGFPLDKNSWYAHLFSTKMSKS